MQRRRPAIPCDCSSCKSTNVDGVFGKMLLEAQRAIITSLLLDELSARWPRYVFGPHDMKLVQSTRQGQAGSSTPRFNSLSVRTHVSNYCT